MTLFFIVMTKQSRLLRVLNDHLPPKMDMGEIV